MTATCPTCGSHVVQNYTLSLEELIESLRIDRNAFTERIVELEAMLPCQELREARLHIRTAKARIKELEARIAELETKGVDEEALRRYLLGAEGGRGR